MSFNRRFICLNYRLIAVFMLFFQAGFAQYNFEEVDQLLATQKQVFGGKAVVLVYKDAKMIYKKEMGEDFKSETPEPIGAGSKWLTAALVMTFVEKGEISLDDRVSRYLPIFASYSKSYITIRHCLAEITGIESEQKSLGKLLQKKKFKSLEEEVNYFASHRDIVAAPGKEFFYGDIGLNIAGRILEVISKRKTFAKLMQERITKPLGMKKTTFANENNSEDPSAGGISTAGDYIKFMTMILNNGEYNGNRILKKESIEEMEKIQFSALPVKSSPKLTQGFQYGYGVWIEETDKNGNSKVISSPDPFGTWPYIDRCRKYACIILMRRQASDENQALRVAIKEEITKKIQPSCDN